MLQQYKDAIEKTNIISKTDTEGIITFVNDEFCAISGYTRAELLGKNHNIIRHPDVDARKFKLLWETIKKKNIYKGTVKNRAKNGASFYVNTTVIPILDANAEIVEYIAIRYDVTQEVLYK
ncbi:MAG: PAS domain-containing protein, partial [Sulfurimonas sp.]